MSRTDLDLRSGQTLMVWPIRLPRPGPSFEPCLRDFDALLEAIGVDRPLLVGWSYGAAVAVHWADRNPDRVAGVVSVDGAVSCDLTGKDGRERIRRLFRRMRLLLSLASRLGWPRG
jgi:pimeloyl-ACP methyl ester carboxylesterase